MPSALAAAIFGFLLGLRHATDADHVVAITTIVSRERSFRRAAWIGGLWGVGHSLTVLVVGGALVVTRRVIPPRLGLGLEFGVALMLILLGFSALRTGERSQHHRHDAGSWFRGLRPLAVGVVHGLAGSAAVALLVLAAIPETGRALAYLAVFGLGTIAGMTIVTAMLAAPAVFAAGRLPQFQHGVRLAAGVLSVAVGVLMAQQIVTSGGLFAAEPSWSPR